MEANSGSNKVHIAFFRRRSSLIAIGAVIGLPVIYALIVFRNYFLPPTTLAAFMKKDIPTIEVVGFLVDDDVKIPKTKSITGLRLGPYESSSPLPQNWESCSVTVAGYTADHREKKIVLERKTAVDSAAKAPIDPNSEEKKGCTDFLIYQVQALPAFITMHVVDGDSVWSWLRENPDLDKFFGTEVGKGLFYEVMNTAKLSGENLKLNTVSGKFVEAIFKDSLRADASIDYSPASGKAGFVYSFERKKAPNAVRTVGALIEFLAKSRFLLVESKDSIFTLWLGQQEILIAEKAGRIWLATGISGMLNAWETVRTTKPSQVKGTLTAELRMESVLGSLVEKLAGSSMWHAYFGWELSANSSKPAAGSLDKASAFDGFGERISPALLQAIPQDTFAVVALPIEIPARALDLTKPKSQESLTNSAAVLWDLDAETSTLSVVGIAVEAKTAGGLTKVWADLWGTASRTSCQKDKIYLFATSEKLFTRMREACDRQSASIADWSDASIDLKAQQIVVLVNLAVALNETFRFGAAHELGVGPQKEVEHWENQSADPESKREMEKMVQSIYMDSRTALRTLPVFGFAGAKAPDGHIKLDGFTKNGVPL
jgi:hypothetical protein